MEILDNEIDINKLKNEEKNINIHKKLLRYIGLAKKAGAVVAGVDLVINSIQKKKAFIVFYSEDISVPSLKKLKDKSAFYNTEIHGINLNMNDLGHLVGLKRPAAAVCVTEKNFLIPISELLHQLTSTTLTSYEEGFFS